MGGDSSLFGDLALQLFLQIDLDPAGGFVSENELTWWYIQQNQKDELHRTTREIEKQDYNKDGFVSFAEFEAPSWFTSADTPDGTSLLDRFQIVAKRGVNEVD